MSDGLREDAAFEEWLVARQEAIDRGDTERQGDSTPAELAEREAVKRAAAERCLLALDSIRRSQSLAALSTETTTRSGPGNDGQLGDVDVPGRIGRFEIIREVGRGGSGVVFQARDPKLDRDVALKVPRPEALLTADLRKRFLREANAAALLSHPGIVPIFEVGDAGPIIFIAAEYCDAVSLATWIDRQDGPIEPHVAAELVAELADAIEHAHARGVLHRDLKPSNVVIAGKAQQPDRDQLPGRLRITDFGLAKLMATDETATRTGAVLGTPSYMAPEQADARIGEQTERTDVYGLGAILYELLTGDRPFREETDVDTLIAVRQAEPKQPRRLRSDLPRDLEAICLKCLEKRAKDRYPSAAALAVDLRRFLAGEPTEARPLAPLQRASRWIRRNRLASTLMAVIVASATAMTLGAYWHVDRLKTQLEANRQLREQAEARERTERRRRYVADIRLAGKLWHQSNLGELQRTLEPQIPKLGQEDSRCFVWHYLWRRCHSQLTTYRGHTGTVSAVAFTPDGKRLATGGWDGTVRIFETHSGRELGVLSGHEREVNCIAFFANGERLVTGDSGGFARIWDAQSLEQVGIAQADAEDLLCLAVNPDGDVLATGGLEGVIRLWSLPELSPLGAIGADMELGWVRALSFSSDGSQLASGDNEKTARIWDWRSQRQLRGYVGHQHWVTSVAFHPDGNLLVSGSADRHVILWDATKEARIQTSRRLAQRIRAVRFSPHGEYLAIAGNDTRVSIWRSADLLKTGEVGNVFEIMAHAGDVWDVAFSPDGKTIVTAGADGFAKRWRMGDSRYDETWTTAGRPEFGPLRLPGQPVELAEENGVRVLERWRGVEEAQVDSPAETPFQRLDISPNGRYVAMIGDGNRLTVVPTEGKGQPMIFGHTAGMYNDVAFGDDNRTVYACYGTSEVIAFDIEGGSEPVKTLSTGGPLQINGLRCSPDGCWLFAGDNIGANAAVLFDLMENRVHTVLDDASANCAFSRDGRLLATGSANGPIRIWDVPAARLRCTAAGNGKSVKLLAFSPDSRILASNAEDAEITFWSVRSGEELLTLPIPSHPDHGMAFADDGKSFITCGSSEGRMKFLFYSGTDPTID